MNYEKIIELCVIYFACFMFVYWGFFETMKLLFAFLDYLDRKQIAKWSKF